MTREIFLGNAASAFPPFPRFRAAARVFFFLANAGTGA